MNTSASTTTLLSVFLNHPESFVQNLNPPLMNVICTRMSSLISTYPLSKVVSCKTICLGYSLVFLRKTINLAKIQ